MAVDMGTAVAHIDLDIKGFKAKLSEVKKDFMELPGKLSAFGESATATGEKLVGVGTKLTVGLTAPLLAVGTAATKSAIEFESAFTGVQKTVDATGEEYAALSKGITEMSERMPQSASAIAGVMEAAGQLGVRGVQNLLDFTETMIMLGDATNLTSEEAAMSIAKVMNIFGTANEDVGRFGATIVDLGNNYATTEADIVSMTNRLAAGARIAGLTEAQTLALATAMSSVGIEAEAGGTAMTQTFNAIETAVAHGGENLEKFAKVAGMSATSFADMWGNRPVEALQAFIGGLGNLEENGENTVLVLDDLGLSGIRQSNMLKSLALASDMLAETVDTANNAWDENVALTNEANKRYQTFESQLQTFLNTLSNVGREFGQIILPYLQKLLNWAKEGLQKFRDLDDSTKNMIVRIAAIAAAIGPLLIAVGKVMTAVGSINTLLGSMGATGGTIAIAIAGFAALGTILWAVAQNGKLVTDGAQEIRESVEKSVESFDKANEKYEKSAAEISATATVAEDYVAILEELEQQYGKAAGEQEEYQVTIEKLKAVMPELNVVIDEQTGLISGGTQALRDQIDAWEDLAIQQARQQLMQDKMNAYIDLVKTSAEATVEKTRAEKDLARIEGERTLQGAKLVDMYNREFGTSKNLSEIYGELLTRSVGWSDELRGQAMIYDGLARNSITATQAVADYTVAEQDAKTAMEEGKNVVDEYNNALEEYGFGVEETSEKQVELTTAVEETNDAVANSDAAYSSVDELMQAHGHTLDELASKYEDLEGQVHNAFEVIKQDSSVSYEEMKKNLEENLKIMQNWSSEVQLAFERAGKLGIDEGFVQYLVDLGPQGAKYLHEFLEQSDAEWEAIAEVWSEGASGAYYAAANALSVAPGEFEKIGRNSAQGFVDGVNGVDVTAPITAMANNVIGVARTTLEIRSPSKVFEGIGEFVMEGFFNGVAAKEPSVLEQMGGIYSKIIGKFDGGSVDMASKGRSIMDGLWSGLRETWNSISSWLSGVANSISGFFSGIGSKASSKSSFKGSKKFGMYQYANGLDYVPRTMQVTVHEGERILTKAENQQYGTNSGVSVYVNANVSNDYDVERLGVKLGESIRNQIRGTGGDLAWN